MGVFIDTCWVYDFESWRAKLLGEIAIASVGSIVASGGLEDKKNDQVNHELSQLESRKQ